MTCRVEPRPSSPIASSECAEAILLAVCQSVEVAEKENFEGAPVDPYSEEEDNDAFLNQCLSEESSSEEEHTACSSFKGIRVSTTPVCGIMKGSS